jgi:hypothetical protein
MKIFENQNFFTYSPLFSNFKADFHFEKWGMDKLIIFVLDCLAFLHLKGMLGTQIKKCCVLE